MLLYVVHRAAVASFKVIDPWNLVVAGREEPRVDLESRECTNEYRDDDGAATTADRAEARGAFVVEKDIWTELVLALKEWWDWHLSTCLFFEFIYYILSF